MRDIAQGLVLDLATLAVGTSQEMSVVGLPLMHSLGGGYMYRTASIRHTPILAHPLINVKPYSWLHNAAHSMPGSCLAVPQIGGNFRLA